MASRSASSPLRGGRLCRVSPLGSTLGSPSSSSSFQSPKDRKPAKVEEGSSVRQGSRTRRQVTFEDAPATVLYPPVQASRHPPPPEIFATDIQSVKGRKRYFQRMMNGVGSRSTEPARDLSVPDRPVTPRHFDKEEERMSVQEYEALDGPAKGFAGISLRHDQEGWDRRYAHIGEFKRIVAIHGDDIEEAMLDDRLRFCVMTAVVYGGEMPVTDSIEANIMAALSKEAGVVVSIDVIEVDKTDDEKPEFQSGVAHIQAVIGGLADPNDPLAAWRLKDDELGADEETPTTAPDDVELDALGEYAPPAAPRGLEAEPPTQGRFTYLHPERVTMIIKHEFARAGIPGSISQEVSPCWALRGKTKQDYWEKVRHYVDYCWKSQLQDAELISNGIDPKFARSLLPLRITSNGVPGWSEFTNACKGAPCPRGKCHMKCQRTPELVGAMQSFIKHAEDIFRHGGHVVISSVRFEVGCGDVELARLITCWHYKQLQRRAVGQLCRWEVFVGTTLITDRRVLKVLASVQVRRTKEALSVIAIVLKETGVTLTRAVNATMEGSSNASLDRPHGKRGAGKAPTRKKAANLAEQQLGGGASTSSADQAQYYTFPGGTKQPAQKVPGPPIQYHATVCLPQLALDHYVGTLKRLVGTPEEPVYLLVGWVLGVDRQHETAPLAQGFLQLDSQKKMTISSTSAQFLATGRAGRGRDGSGRLQRMSIKGSEIVLYSTG